jgi:hypothetical protein
MSLLDGLAGVGIGLAGAGSAISAQKQADRLERELVIREAQEGRDAVKERERLDVAAANQNMLMVDDAGLFNDTKTRIDLSKAAAKLEAGDAASIDAMKNIARTSGLIDPSVKDIRFAKAPDGKGWVIQTSNADGTFGVITADGSSDPNAPVAQFATLEDFAKSADIALGASRRIQTAYDIQGALAAEGIVDQDFRELEESIKDQPVEQQVAIRRGVIAGAANIEDPTERQQFIDSVASGEPPPEPEAPAPETTTSPEELPRGRQELIEYRKTPEYQAKANAATIERKKGQLEKAEARVKDLEESGRNARALRAARGTVSTLKNEISELEPATFAMDTPEQQASVDKVVEETKDMPTDQVVEKVMSGEVTMSPQEQAAVAAQLQAAGVQTVNDLAKLENRRDRAMARVAMIAAIGGTSNDRAPDRATQRDMLQQISNIFETGTASMSAKDATDAQLRSGALEARLGELRRGIAQDIEAARATAVESGQDLLNSWSEATQGDYSSNAAATWIQTELAPYLLEAQNAPSEAAADIYLQALNPAVGKVLASLAADERGGFMESFVSTFRGDVSDSSVGATDFNLDRVEGVYETRDGKEVLVGFYYQDANGRRLDEMVSAGRMRRLNEDIYNILAFAAQKNASS